MHLSLRTKYGYTDVQRLSANYGNFPAGAVRVLAMPTTPLTETKLTELAAHYAVDCNMHVDARMIDALFCFHTASDRNELIDRIAPYVTLLSQITDANEILRNSKMINGLC